MRPVWRPRRGQARSSMWVASTSRSSRSCWSPRSRSRPRGAPSTPASPHLPTRSRCTLRPSGPSPSTGRTGCASMAGAPAGGAPRGPAEAREASRRPRGGAGGGGRAAGLVFAAMIRTVAMGGEEPGLRPLSAALEEEGFDDLGSGRLVESFARHLMVALDAWQEQGFGEIAKNYLARLAPESGVRRDIAENGDLLVRRVVANAGSGEAEQRSLLRALDQPSWLDPATGGPRK